MPKPKLSICHLAYAALVLLVIAQTQPLRAETNADWHHGLSTFGELAYPPDFKHFKYVNPKAPKGGKLSMIGDAGLITFDSLNAYILKGDAAQGMQFTFDSLMVRAFDEPDAVYGLVAEKAKVSADRLSASFKLRPKAKFSDGSPLTAEDVAFSLQALKEKGHPTYRFALRDVVSAEAIDTHTVKYTFKGELTRDLALNVATLPIFSKAYYTKQPFEQTSLDPPLGSGPYKVADFKPGTFISYKRRNDYWAKDLNVNVGRFNFDELRYEYYRDRGRELESLKAGAYDLREEFTSKDWATAYNIPAVKEGKLIRLTIPDERPGGAQGFFINTRRDKFKDPNVRKALDFAFDFEWTNKNLFFGLYKRTASFFENSEMKAEGPPSPEELALLEPFRDQLSPEVFGEPYSPPVSNGSGADRKLLRQAAQLLDKAGWLVQNGTRVNTKGEKLDVEFLIFSPSFERVIGPYVENLKRIGVDARIRRVDPAQFERRRKSFDFDITTTRYIMNLTPGVELKNYWSSQAASAEGTNNLAGIKSPVVDALVDKVMSAGSRTELVTAARAIDRVLRAGHYWVPHWYKAAHNIAHWNKFSRPEVKPRYDRGVITTWWYDAEKAAKLQPK